MRNKLTDLNNLLFEQLERIGDDSLTNEEFDRELKRNDAIVSVSTTIIKNGELALKSLKFQDDRYDISKPLPAMLSDGNE